MILPTIIFKSFQLSTRILGRQGQSGRFEFELLKNYSILDVGEWDFSSLRWILGTFNVRNNRWWVWKAALSGSQNLLLLSHQSHSFSWVADVAHEAHSRNFPRGPSIPYGIPVWCFVHQLRTTSTCSEEPWDDLGLALLVLYYVTSRLHCSTVITELALLRISWGSGNDGPPIYGLRKLERIRNILVCSHLAEERWFVIAVIMIGDGSPRSSFWRWRYDASESPRTAPWHGRYLWPAWGR